MFQQSAPATVIRKCPTLPTLTSSFIKVMVQGENVESTPKGLVLTLKYTTIYHLDGEIKTS